MSYWRNKARPIVSEVLAETAGKPEHEVRKALHDAYPFGERRYHPYKIWLDEIIRQRAPKAGKTGPCARCGHGNGSHRGYCHAADCKCVDYTTENEQQGRLAL